MRRFKPLHGVLIVLAVLGAVLGAQAALELRSNPSGFEQVSPEKDGTVRIGIADLKPREVRFYRFINTGNQEVRFLVGRDGEGVVQVGFDAGETHGRAGRGFRHEGDWLVDNKCDTASRLAEVNGNTGGCRPVPLKHRIEGDQLVLAENDILQGWRLFS
jgi:uncharacterized membrane protein